MTTELEGDFSPAKAGFEMTTLFMGFLRPSVVEMTHELGNGISHSRICVPEDKLGQVFLLSQFIF